MHPRPFDIHVADEVLDDLRRRLRGTRRLDQPAGAGWDLGTDRAFLSELVDCWADGVRPARAQERRLNRFNNLRVRIDGADLHCVHERGYAAVQATRPQTLAYG